MRVVHVLNPHIRRPLTVIFAENVAFALSTSYAYQSINRRTRTLSSQSGPPSVKGGGGVSQEAECGNKVQLTDCPTKLKGISRPEGEIIAPSPPPPPSLSSPTSGNVNILSARWFTEKTDITSNDKTQIDK
jgi:hypothetical protein